MRSGFMKFVSAIISCLGIGVCAVFGIIFWNEFQQIQTVAEPENFKTVIASNQNTIDKDIKAPEIVENVFDSIQDKKETPKVNYNNVSINNYFYNQLEEESQYIYKAFESNKENMKTGTYQIELGNEFSSLLSTENGQDQLGNYYQSAIEAYTYDNPDVFYLSPNKMYLNIETTTRGSTVTYNVYINQGKGSNYLIDEFQSKEQVDRALIEIKENANQVLQKKTGNAQQDIKMVHDYLVDTVEYDTTLSKSNIYNIYGAMIQKEAVCEGYARAFKYYMDKLGIPCVLGIGKGTNSEGKTENHAWNYVEVEGTWYAIDVTWDDPVIIGGGSINEATKYKYFLKNAKDFYKDHTPSRQFTEGGKNFNYPQI